MSLDGPSTPIQGAKEALLSAGRALEANAPHGQDLAEASKHLCDGLHQAMAEGDRALAALGGRERAEALVRTISRPDVRAYDLERAELFLAKAIEQASGRRALERADKRVFVLVAAVVIAALCGIGNAIITRALSSDGLRFEASSETYGFPLTGKIGDKGDFGLFFHTTTEDHPWVEIDLGKPRKVHRVTIENRADCCVDRAIPLVVELRDAAGEYHEVARRDDVFDAWTAEFPPQEATRVKLVVPRVTALHLADVQIR